METNTAEQAFADAQCASAASTLLQPAAVGDMPISTISPELALVDPELAAELRRRLPLRPVDTWSTTARDSRPVAPPSRPVGTCELAPSTSETVRGQHGPIQRLRAFGHAPLVAVTAVFGLSVLFGPLIVTSVSRGVGGGSAGATAPFPAPAPVAEGYDIRWSPVPGASYYNLVLEVQGARALDLWPRQAHVHIPGGSLPPGRYTWFAYPAVRAGARPSYGSLAARGDLTVPVTNPPFASG